MSETKDTCGCCTLIYESEGVKIVQREGVEGYELVMPSGNRNIWFTDKEAAIYCASVVGSCWLEAEACGAIEERENGVVAHENKALRSALTELVEAAGEYCRTAPDVCDQRTLDAAMAASDKTAAALAAASSLLNNTPNTEKGGS